MNQSKGSYSWWPLAVVIVGWAWQCVACRLAFGNKQPEFGFYHRPNGQALKLWLSDIPTGIVVVLVLTIATWVCRLFLREQKRLAAVIYLILCLVLLAIFAMPGAWAIDMIGRGDFFI